MGSNRIASCLFVSATMLGFSSIASAQPYYANIDGCATSVDSGGTETWATGCSGSPNHGIYRRVSGTWELQNGSGVMIAVSKLGVPWVINAAGQIWKRSGSSWTQFPGCATSIAVGTNDTNAWITGCSGGDWRKIYQWNGSSWVQRAGQAFEVGVDHFDNTAWVRTVDGSTWRWNGSSFVQVSGCAIGIGGGILVGCDAESIWVYDDASNAWEPYTGNHDLQDVSNNGNYILRTDGSMGVRQFIR